MRKFLSIVLLSSLLVIPTAYSSDNTSKNGAATAIKEQLKKQFPDLVINDISESQVKGIYQVTAGATVLYLTQDARFAFSGDLIDLKQGQTNLTEEVRKGARLKSLNKINEKNMVIFPAKNAKHTLTVFTDVDCGYCRKLHEEISKLNELGITVRYLAFPRSGPNSPTFEKMVSIWCAKDKKQALTLAKQDKTVEKKSCDNNGVLEEFQLGMMMGVSGTPTLIFEDGSMFPGYLPADKILEVADMLAKKQKPTV